MTRTKLLSTLVFVTAFLAACNGSAPSGALAEGPSTSGNPTTINLGALPPDPSRSFVNLVSVKIKPELLTEFLATLRDYAAKTREEPGVLRYDIHQSPHDPTVIELYEFYRDTEARTFHNATAHRNDFFGKVAARGYFAQPAAAKVVYLIDPQP